MGKQKTDRVERAMIAAFQQMKADGKVQTPDPATPIEIDPGALLTLVCWGDPQISSYSPLRTARFDAACQDVANIDGAVDAIILAGDICEFGAAREFRMTQRVLSQIGDHCRHYLCVPGNHDIRVREYYHQQKRFFDFIASLPGGIAPADHQHYYHTAEINGFTFLMLGSDRNTFESAYLGRRQLERLDADLTAACAKGKPVFVINHQTLRRHNGLPVTWLGKGDWRGDVGKESDKLRAIFEKHRNVVFITGHLHYGTSAYNFEDYGSYVSLSLQTVGVVNHGAFDAPSQGYVVTVFEDRVEFRARLFGEGKYVDPAVPNAAVTWYYK